jgi:hypothetical protein
VIRWWPVDGVLSMGGWGDGGARLDAYPNALNDDPGGTAQRAISYGDCHGPDGAG